MGNSYVTENHVRQARNLEPEWHENIAFLKNYMPIPGKKFAVVFRKEGRQGLKEYIFKSVKFIENQDRDRSILFSFNGSDLPLLDIEILDVVEVVTKKRKSAPTGLDSYLEGLQNYSVGEENIE